MLKNIMRDHTQSVLCMTVQKQIKHIRELFKRGKQIRNFCIQDSLFSQYVDKLDRRKFSNTSREYLLAARKFMIRSPSYILLIYF